MVDMGDNNINKTVTKRGTAFIQETGEVVNLHTSPLEKVRYGFTGGWRAFGVIELNRLFSLGLTRTELMVALWLPTIAKQGNIVVVSGKMAKAALQIDRHYFSAILGKLVKLDLIKRGETRGVYYINPQFAWHGSAASHRIAREQWYKESLVIKPQFNRAAG
jgi:hydrogenase maturation factor